MSELKNKTAIEQEIKVLFKKNQDAFTLPSVLMVIGTWIGALFIFGFLAITQIFSISLISFIIGLILLFFTFLISKSQDKKNIFLNQGLFICSFVGQFLLFKEVLSFSSASFGVLILAILQLGLFFLINNKFHRFLMFFSFNWSLFFYFADFFNMRDAFNVIINIILLLLIPLQTILWVNESRFLIKLKDLFYPLAYSSIFTAFSFLLIKNLLGGLDRTLTFDTIILNLIILFCFLYFIIKTVQNLDQKLENRHYLLLIATIITSVLTWQTSGIMFSLLILFLSHFRKEKVLKFLSWLFLTIFLVSFYYQMNVPLLQKSAWMLLSGISLLFLYFVLDFLWQKKDKEKATIYKSLESVIKNFTKPYFIKLIASLTIFLAIIGWMIFEKEKVVANGQTFLLELAPVDPRSIMQGDYMILNYDILSNLDSSASAIQNLEMQNQTNAQNDNENLETKLIFPSLEIKNKNGLVILKMDQNKVASFVEFDNQNRQLKSDEIKVKYISRKAQSKFWIAPESFLFTEGEAEKYQVARYAELKVSEKGDVVLIGLIDKDFDKL
jgi:uncharacterized membrane-anchored protein